MVKRVKKLSFWGPRDLDIDKNVYIEILNLLLRFKIYKIGKK